MLVKPEYFNKQDYREFTDPKLAHQWGLDNYHEWIDRLKRDLPQNPNEKSTVQSYITAKHNGSVSDLLFSFTGSKNIEYNKLLYGNYYKDDYDEDEKVDLLNEIEKISTALRQLSTPENIVVYRFTHKMGFASYFPNDKPKRGEVVLAKGFLSTTLVAESLLGFAQEHRYNCLIKLYLPKGTKGAYIWHNDGLNEQEFLLPPNAKLKLIRKRLWSRKLMTLYECVLVDQ